MPTSSKSEVHVVVYDPDANPIDDARVALHPLDATSGERTVALEAVPGRGYVAHGVRPGAYRLSASAEGRDSDERDVQVDPAGLCTIVILGEPELPFLYRGTVRMPFRPHPRIVALSLSAPAGERERERVGAAAERLALERVELSEEAARENVLAFSVPDGQEPARVITALEGIEGVAHAGVVVKIDRNGVSFLTRELVVKFKSHVDLDAVPQIAGRFDLETLRTLPQAGNAFLYRAPGPATYALLDIAARLVDSGEVEYAEPNLVGTTNADAVTPTDFLYPMQWHLPLVGCPDAWQTIHDDVGVASTFGSANLRIAVVDSGVDLTNPDFVGTVSNGSPKVAAAFDFANMAPDNNARIFGHGTCCAGIATSLPNNASGVAGQNAGGAGSAGNCRLMAIRYPGGGTEVQFSDMYTWVGGFDPHSSTPSFPAAIAPGADVITNSYGAFTGMPISGLMKDTFDLLTTYGRGGRGVLLFFSAANNNQDFTLDRPWAAYTRTIAVAASTLATDGVTEIRAPYSNFGGAGIIDVCAPSDTKLGDPYDPPRSYGTVTATDLMTSDFPPDAPSHWTAKAAMSAAAGVGATSLAVVSSAGFAANDVIVVGSPGSPGTEFGRVTSVPNATHLNVSALKNPHGAGTVVSRGPATMLTNFGGTSSATPLTAGVGALLLTIRPNLSWVQVRDLLRDTSVQIDAGNTNALRIWRDGNGVAFGQPGYMGPVYSRAYGFGRIDADAAVNGAIALGASDVVIRDQLGDTGLVPSVGAFWHSPDIWVRNVAPAVEGAAALPASYGVAGATLDVLPGQANYVYARIRNTGTAASSTFFVRVYLAHWAGTEFVYPTNFVPTTHPGDPLPSPLVTGTYLLGEVQHGPLAAGADDVVHVTWPAAAVPPETVTVGAVKMHWHPCLLVEISPHDGPAPSGTHVWDHNDLAQTNVTVAWADDNDALGAAIVVGNLLNESEGLEIELDRSKVPAAISLFVDVLDPMVKRRLRSHVQQACDAYARRESEVAEPALVGRGSYDRDASGDDDAPLPDRRSCATLAHHHGREVFVLPGDDVVRLALPASPGARIPIVVGAMRNGDGDAREGTYEVSVVQRDADGTRSGSAAVQVHV